MWVNSEEESADLPVLAEMSKRPNTSKPNGKHHVFTHVPKDPNCKLCKLTNTTRAPCRNRPEARRDRAYHPQNIGDAITADHKFLSEENESRLQQHYTVVVQDLYFCWIQSYPTKKNKTAQETTKSLQQFGQPDQKPGIIHTDNSLECIRVREDLGWNHDKSTPYR